MILQCCVDCTILLRVFSTVGDTIISVEGYHLYIEGCSVLQGIPSVLWEHIQHCEGIQSVLWRKDTSTLGITSTLLGITYLVVDVTICIAPPLAISNASWIILALLSKSFFFQILLLINSPNNILYNYKPYNFASSNIQLVLLENIVINYSNISGGIICSRLLCRVKDFPFKYLVPRSQFI